MKTILVPASGTATDDSVFATARALARTLGAHMAFYHIRLTPGDAALRVPHLGYCVNPSLPAALGRLDDRLDELSARARSHVRDFCQAEGIVLAAGAGAAASWIEETGDPDTRLMLRARHADLVVLGRPRHADCMPSGLIERLLTGAGRPVVLAPDKPPRPIIERIVVGWKETPEAARALAASLPLLKAARQVILLQVGETPAPGQLADLARHLARHGIDAETHEVVDPIVPASVLLPATAARLRADLLVIGGFSHAPLREMILGGVTRSVIEHAEMPILLQH